MKHITQQQADYIRAHVNDRPRVKVARDAGVSLDTVYRIVREAGGEMRYEHTRRNPEHVEIVRRCYPVMTTREIADRYGINYGRINKIAAELGVMSGLRPLTKFRMKAMQRKAYQAKWTLCRRHGYMEAEGAPYLLLYDDTTLRSKNESYYTKKYGLKFEYYGAETENDNNNLLEGQRHCP